MSIDQVSSSIKTHLSKTNPPSFSSSRSTPSLPNLVNYAIPSTMSNLSIINNTSISLSHGSNEHNINYKLIQKTKNSIVCKRRHSFSSFLDVKCRKKINIDDETDNDKTSRLKIMSDDNSFLNSARTNGPTAKSVLKKKRYRPRSYSEMSSSLPRVERAPPVAITNKIPAYEYYGFVMYLSSFVAFGIYLIWAYVPDEILHRLGITYYPSRYWALAIPIWLMTFVWFIFISFMTVNLMNTAPFDSLYCITGKYDNAFF
ncbi:PIG-P-domain-containing protein [Cokeromyces recurvatus]|uniref:PIG-P-domain-containing protein n=1 Tax=Cokeromyces recurvatus TaxID=90255 RepID=UPI0022201538|nr:PIG-P-domain-containing protein [Cokeromyces recurvatus]KAI7899846.1 PIG-P-domain-containing protein [Cokeromyces recurvatus]